MDIYVDTIFREIVSNKITKSTSVFELKIGEICEHFIGLGKVAVKKIENDKVYLLTRLNNEDNKIVLSPEKNFIYSPDTVDVSVTYKFYLK